MYPHAVYVALGDPELPALETNTLPTEVYLQHLPVLSPEGTHYVSYTRLKLTILLRLPLECMTTGMYYHT